MPVVSVLCFFFSCCGDHRDLHVLTHSFPTRRSSDLVAIDVAGQLLKSLNGAVLRTGAAALRTVTTLVDQVLRPALADAGLDRKSTRLTPVTNAQLVCRLLLEKKKNHLNIHN